MPNHSSFSKNRHGRFRQSDILRHLFETVVEHCLAQGLVGAEGFAVDASLIAADANKQRSVPSAEWKTDEAKDDASRSVQEYLAVLDDAAFGAASPVTPKFISPSDPAAQWTGAHKGHAFFAYATNYLIDTDHGVILDVEATRAIRQAEVGASRTMIDRTEFGLKPRYVVADSATARPTILPGSSNTSRSRRIARSSTSPTEPMARGLAMTSSGTARMIVTFAPRVRSSSAFVGTTPTLEERRQRTVRFAIARVRKTATRAHRSLVVARTCRIGRYRVT